MNANDFHSLHDCFTKQTVDEPLFTEFLHVWLPKKVQYLAAQEAGNTGEKLNYNDMEEIKLSVILLITDKIEQINSGIPFRSFICQAIKFKAKNFIRKKRKETLVDMTEDSNVISIQVEKNRSSSSLSEIQNEKLMEYLSLIPYSRAAPFLLKYVEGYSSKEIAEILGITVEKVDQRNFRTRKKLEESLIKYFPQFR